MNITKDQIRDVADKMVAPLEEAKQATSDRISEALYAIAICQIPTDVIEFSVKYPKETLKSFRAAIKDSDGDTNGYSAYVPFGDYFADYDNASGEEQASMVPLVDAYVAAKDILRSTRNRISCMLSNLRTHKKIADEFPEAYTVLCELLKLPENKSNRCDDVEKLRADLSVLTKSK